MCGSAGGRPGRDAAAGDAADEEPGSRSAKARARPSSAPNSPAAAPSPSRSPSHNCMPQSGPAPLLGRPVTITGLGILRPRRTWSPTTIWRPYLDTSDEWIRQRTGISERRMAAARRLLVRPWHRSRPGSAGRRGYRSRRSVDLVITATISPDQTHAGDGCARRLRAAAASTPEPSTCRPAAPASSTRLAMAAGAVASGMHDNVLVVGAETISRGARLGRPVDRDPLRRWRGRGGRLRSERRPGAGAGGHPGLRPGQRRLGGRLCSASRRAARGCRPPSRRWTGASTTCKMNGKEVYKFATRVVAALRPAGCLDTLRLRGRAISTSSCLIRPICASSRAAAEKLGIPEDKVYTNLQKYGNTSAASIPLCLSEAGRKDDSRTAIWCCSWVSAPV